MKIITIVGTRPQFIKAAAVSRAIAVHNRTSPKRVDEVILHTGQHYDENLSRIFFDELDIPEPSYNLGIGSLPHGAQTGRMLEAIEQVLMEVKPDWVLVYGDTNSTLAGVIAAKKLQLRTAHVEAGLRSFNLQMPEEINRILTDRISDVLFCPTDTAVKNLHREGNTTGIEKVGDVMYDSLIFFRKRAHKLSHVLKRLGLKPKSFVLATVHRAENTDDPGRLAGILDGLAGVSEDCHVILAIHPRTRKFVEQHGLEERLGKIEVIEPVSYLDMIRLEESARTICTDSGGVQKEAFFLGVPCITLRGETEWVETVDSGWNQLVGIEPNRVVLGVRNAKIPQNHRSTRFYGNGNAANRIVKLLVKKSRS